MDSTLPRVIFCFCILVSFVGLVSADQQPFHRLYVQGGENSVTGGVDDNLSFMIKDVVPYINYEKNGKNTLVPVTLLSNSSLPATAALVMADGNNESVSIVTISHIALTQENTTLTLQISPEKFYEGEGLSSFNSSKEDIQNLIDKKFSNIGIYIEKIEKTKDNGSITDCDAFCKYKTKSNPYCVIYCEDTRSLPEQC